MINVEREEEGVSDEGHEKLKLVEEGRQTI
jgi:hypothetical protein